MVGTSAGRRVGLAPDITVGPTRRPVDGPLLSAYPRGLLGRRFALLVRPASRMGSFAPRRPAGLAAPVLAVLALGLVVFMVQQDTTFAAAYLSEASAPPLLASYVPAGACIVSDYPSDLIATGLFNPSHPGCPAVVDPFTMYVTDDDGNSPHLSPPGFPAQFPQLWLAYFKEAQYVELLFPYGEDDLIPWTPYLTTWFSHNYRLVAHFQTVYAKPFIDSYKDTYLYKRIG